MPSRRDSVGGGVVTEFFCALRKPSRFSGGGGVVAEFFPGLQKPTRFSGGGGSTRNFPIMGPFYIFRPPSESATGLLCSRHFSTKCRTSLRFRNNAFSQDLRYCQGNASKTFTRRSQVGEYCVKDTTEEEASIISVAIR